MSLLNKTDKELLFIYNKHRDIVKKADKEVKRNWEWFYQMYIGNHWKNQDPNNPRPVTNFCRAALRGQVALLTDNKPQISALPIDKKQDTEKAALAKRIFDNVWDKYDCHQRVSEVLYDAGVFGTGFWKVLWNGKTAQIEIIPSEFISIDPFCSDISKAQVILQEQPMPLATVKSLLKGSKTARWGEIDMLKGDPSYNFEINRHALNNTTSNSDSQTFYSNTEGTAVAQTGMAGTKNWIREDSIGINTVYSEMWIWDEDLEDYVVLTVAEQRVIDIKQNPLRKQKIKRSPFVPFYNYKDSNMVWGKSEIEDIGGLNRDYNILKATILDHIRLVGNTPWIIDANSGVDPDNLHNAEAIIITKNPGTEVRRDPPPPMSSDAFRLLSELKFEIETITGVREVMQGQRPSGITAGIAIAELQEAAQVPIREKARRLQSSLNYAAKLIWDILNEFYTEKMIIRIIEGSEIKFEEIPSDMFAGEYDVYFDVESGFGQTRSAKVDKAMKLYSMQLTDRRGVLEAIGDPDREEVMRRMAITEGAIQLREGIKSGAINPNDLSGQMGGDNSPIVSPPTGSA